MPSDFQFALDCMFKHTWFYGTWTINTSEEISGSETSRKVKCQSNKNGTKIGNNKLKLRF